MTAPERRRARRNILIAGAGAVAAAALGYGLRRPDPLDLLSRRVLALFPEAAAAAARIHPSPPLAAWGADRATLARAIFGSSLGRLARDRPEATLDMLARAVDDDFQAGRVTLVDGWTLAQTEARLIAFIALAGR